MQFTNHTRFPAASLVGSTTDREQTAMVACKVTYRLTESGRLEPAPRAQMWPVYGEPAVFQGVTFLPELEFRKQGIDLIIFGQAEAPQRRATPHLTLRVDCGAVHHRVEVFGDRRWRKAGSTFLMSEPVPFASMPVTNDRAFCGQSLLAGEPVAHAVNPEGRGLCLSQEDVEGKPLPNLERPEALIRQWQQTPAPACFFRPKGILLDPSGPESFDELARAQDPLALPRALATRSFNQSVPGLICPAGQFGRTLTLSGFDAAGDLVFPLPLERAVPGRWGPVVHVAIGRLRSRFPLSVSTVVVLVPLRVVVVTFLALFRYLVRPEEIRRAELRWYGSRSVPAVQKAGIR